MEKEPLVAKAAHLPSPCPASRTGPGLSQLPRDILHHICSFCGLRDLYALDTACCNHYLRPELLATFACTTRLLPLVDFALGAWIARRFPNIRELRTDKIVLLNHNDKLTPEFVNSFLHLETLVIQEYLAIDDAFFDGLGRVRTTLRKLIISNLHDVSGSSLARFLGDCRELRVLRLSSPQLRMIIPEARTVVKALGLCPHLMELSIRDVAIRARELLEVSSLGCLEVLQVSLLCGGPCPDRLPALSLPKLRVLRLAGAIDPSSLVLLIRCCSDDLTEFTVFPHESMDCSEVIPELVDRCPGLRILRLSVLCSFTQELFVSEAIERLALLEAIEFRQHKFVGRFGSVFCDAISGALLRLRGASVVFLVTNGRFEFKLPFTSRKSLDAFHPTRLSKGRPAVPALLIHHHDRPIASTGSSDGPRNQSSVSQCTTTPGSAAEDTDSSDVMNPNRSDIEAIGSKRKQRRQDSGVVDAVRPSAGDATWHQCAAGRPQRMEMACSRSSSSTSTGISRRRRPRCERSSCKKNAATASDYAELFGAPG
jgi:hypothetical protein